MGSDVERIKERLEIAEVVGGYVKLAKAGQSFKGRCPFHNEKTPSFFVSPARQSYYCFGCGAKGDIFTFVEELEGLSFREALKSLAERAGVTLSHRPEAAKERSEREKLLSALEVATQFFEKELEKNKTAKKYLLSRGITEASMKTWRLGYAPAEWRALYTYMMSLGFAKEVLIKTGLVKPVVSGSHEAAEQLREPYDVFRDRLIFPLSDGSGEIIAFSGRALAKETEPKYLNSPDTALFTKSEVLYGLAKAKERIRRKDYAVLVEGQMDLVLSHQAGVDNTVASSGTAFTAQHLERLKRLSKRIILAFDGDKAGEKAAEKSAELALSLGLEVKIARLPLGSDPADLAKKDPESWKEVLRQALPAIEHFLNLALEGEKDRRKLLKAIEQKILPRLKLLTSSLEISHYVSLIAKRTGVKEEMVWEDAKRAVKPDLNQRIMVTAAGVVQAGRKTQLTPASQPHREMIMERLNEVNQFLEENPSDDKLKKEKSELERHLEQENLRSELQDLMGALIEAETSKDDDTVTKISKKINDVLKRIRNVEVRKELL